MSATPLEGIPREEAFGAAESSANTVLRNSRALSTCPEAALLGLSLAGTRMRVQAGKLLSAPPGVAVIERGCAVATPVSAPAFANGPSDVQRLCPGAALMVGPDSGTAMRAITDVILIHVPVSK